MDIPGYDVRNGDWDLRGGENAYLGRVDFSGKRVLDVGAASGFLSFHMEAKGADVVSYDLSGDYSWDVVPLYGADYKNFDANNKGFVDKINNAYWLGHKAYGSKAKVVYGNVYDIPRDIGMVDISVLGCVLLHVRDPFLALQNILRLTTDTVVITDVYPRFTILRRVLHRLRFPIEVLDVFTGPKTEFVPDSRKQLQGVWWYLWPQLLRRMIGVLGFEDLTTTYHWQKYRNRKWRMYTIVGHRTREHYDY